MTRWWLIPSITTIQAESSLSLRNYVKNQPKKKMTNSIYQITTAINPKITLDNNCQNRQNETLDQIMRCPWLLSLRPPFYLKWPYTMQLYEPSGGGHERGSIFFMEECCFLSIPHMKISQEIWIPSYPLSQYFSLIWRKEKDKQGHSLNLWNAYEPISRSVWTMIQCVNTLRFYAVKNLSKFKSHS